MRECWLAPNATSQPQQIFVDSSIAPANSPAGPGNPVVPAGYIQQIASDGSVDTRWIYVQGQVVSNINQFVVPYFSGGWPPDPQFGQPGHTAQRPVGGNG